MVAEYRRSQIGILRPRGYESNRLLDGTRSRAARTRSCKRFRELAPAPGARECDAARRRAPGRGGARRRASRIDVAAFRQRGCRKRAWRRSPARRERAGTTTIAVTDPRARRDQPRRVSPRASSRSPAQAVTLDDALEREPLAHGPAEAGARACLVGCRTLDLLLHDVQDPGNVGAIIRAAEALRRDRRRRRRRHRRSVRLEGAARRDGQHVPAAGRRRRHRSPTPSARRAPSGLRVFAAVAARRHAAPRLRPARPVGDPARRRRRRPAAGAARRRRRAPDDPDAAAGRVAERRDRRGADLSTKPHGSGAQ